MARQILERCIRGIAVLVATLSVTLHQNGASAALVEWPRGGYERS